MQTKKPTYRTRLMLVDGSNIAHRAMHVGKEPLTDPRSGEDVSLLFRFLKSVYYLGNRFSRYAMVIVWDYGHSEHKLKYYPEYKQHRREKKESTKDEEAFDFYTEYNRQIKKIQNEILPYLGIPQVQKRGVEADDIIYFLTKRYIDTSNIVIASGDKDMWQMIQRGLMIYNPNDQKTINNKDYKDVTNGLSINQWRMFRALTGDPSDNIKGVPGIGKVRAERIVLEHPDLCEPNTLMALEDGAETVKLVERMRKDKSLHEALWKSFRLQSMHYWYRKHYNVELEANYEYQFQRCIAKTDFRAAERWLMKHSFNDMLYGNSVLVPVAKDKLERLKYFLRSHGA